MNARTEKMIDLSFRAEALAREAKDAGFDLTIELQPLMPPAMGHHQHVVRVAPDRHSQRISAELAAMPPEERSKLRLDLEELAKTATAAAQEALHEHAPAVKRSATDYALEHAEYLAKGAEEMLRAVCDLAEAEQAREESDADDSGAVVEAAREGVNERMRSLRSDIYEFRKRRDRAKAGVEVPATAEAPPLPASEAYVEVWEEGRSQLKSANKPYFTADQMRQQWKDGYAAGLAAQASPSLPAPVEEALRDAISVCNSVRMGRDRRVVRDGCVMYLQTAEWCEWLGEVEQKLRAALTPTTPAAAQPAQQPPGFIKPDNDRQVFFYEQDFYVLSNFSAFNLVWDGITFPTSEHAYHWEKFASDDFDNEGNEVAVDIMEAPSAHEAFKIAERNKALRRPEWDEVKVDIMRDILRAKTQQHEYVRRKLLATGDRELIEDSWRDDYWGWGPNRDGKNMLGRLWMEIRAELLASTQHQQDGGKT